MNGFLESALKYTSLPHTELKTFLDEFVEKYETPDFIPGDPISIPHRFKTLQDIEISGLFAAVFSWGLRKTIISKSGELMKRMGDQPYRFVLDHSSSDLKGLLGFKHRTFQEEDLFYFMRFLRHHYTLYPSLETAFLGVGEGNEPEISLEGFYNHFFNLSDVPRRTRKHISHPGTLSTCKRLCMYLRWMIRPGKKGVDFGLWQRIKPSQLYIPLDVHVHRVASRLGLLSSEKKNWSAVSELTRNLRALDPEDPVKYDFALFNLGQLKHPL